MQDFADMAEAHEWTLRRLREMAGRLTEQAYLRASAAAGQDDEAHARWMLVFDRMARGLRLSIALEARLARERRWDAREIDHEMDAAAGGEAGGPGDASWRRRGASAPSQETEPCESDRERDDDGLPATAPLAEHIGRVQAIVEGAAAAVAASVAAPESPELLLRPARPERQALMLQRAERGRLAGRARPPDEPWDVLTAADLADYDLAADDVASPGEPPWRGAG
jgi:hypothetical protein